VQELIAREAHRRYYMHNTSHWLGLDVHDTGLYRVNDQPRLLEPGMVFTVEPGIYVGQDDEQADPRFRGIGVRIEDDVVITKSGHENLSGSIPKTPDDLEALVGES
jgi:Xaa-Pro aminopeptidase